MNGPMSVDLETYENDRYSVARCKHAVDELNSTIREAHKRGLIVDLQLYKPLRPADGGPYLDVSVVRPL